MSSRIREALAEMEQDVKQLRLDPPRAVRARGDSIRRRRAVTAVATVAVGMAAVALPSWHADAGRLAQDAGAAPAVTCLPIAETPMQSTQDSRSDALSNSRNVTIFLKIPSIAAQTEAVDAKLRSLSTVAAFQFVNRQQVWETFKRQYCGSPELIAVTHPDTLPERFAVTLVDPGDYVAVRDALNGMPGVDTVVRVHK